MLEDPVNMYGLLEDEFLVFLRDISTSSSLTVFCCHYSCLQCHKAVLYNYSVYS